MPRASDEAWRDALRPTPKPSTKPTRGKGAVRESAAPPAGDKVAVGTYLPRRMLGELHALAARLYQERGRRVTLADLVAEAVADLLRKYTR